MILGVFVFILWSNLNGLCNLMERTGILNSKSFQALFDDSYFFYKNASEINIKYHESIDPKSKLSDQFLLNQMRSFSRACIISAIAALESLSNHLIKDFKKHDKKDIPERWFASDSKWQNKRIMEWPLIQKIRFLPTICNKKLKSPDEYFEFPDYKLELFCELVTIRNKIVHGKLVPVRISIDTKTKILKADYPENYWPISKIPKDIFNIDFSHADIAYRNVVYIRDKLRDFMPDILDDEYLTKQKIQLDKIFK